MEIISRSNHGFRKGPTFQKIANKPNKNIDYVVNPLKIVRDSYEFSNLINNDDFVEDLDSENFLKILDDLKSGKKINYFVYLNLLFINKIRLEWEGYSQYP